jgi:hypothetical protein
VPSNPSVVGIIDDLKSVVREQPGQPFGDLPHQGIDRIVSHARCNNFSALEIAPTDLSVLTGCFLRRRGRVPLTLCVARRARQFHDLIERRQLQSLLGNNPRRGQHLWIL